MNKKTINSNARLGPHTPPQRINLRAFSNLSLHPLTENGFPTNRARNLVKKHIVDTAVIPVPTISNGDCLFAAFAMSKRRVYANESTQRIMALKMRKMAVEYMVSNEFSEKAPPHTFLEFISDKDFTKMYEGINSIRNKNERNMKTADLNKMHGIRVGDNLKAYANVMSIPGMWGSTIEIEALAHMFKVPVIVLRSDAFQHNHLVSLQSVKPEVRHIAGAEYLTENKTPVFLRYLSYGHYEALISYYGAAHNRNKYGLLQRYKSERNKIPTPATPATDKNTMRMEKAMENAMKNMANRYDKIKTIRAPLKKMGFGVHAPNKAKLIEYVAKTWVPRADFTKKPPEFFIHNYMNQHKNPLFPFTSPYY